MLNTKNVVKAILVASLSAGNLASILLAKYYAIPCAVAGLWIIAFAASLDLHLFNPAASPTVKAENVEQMTVNPAAPDPPRWEADTRPLSPAATSIPEPPPVAINVTGRARNLPPPRVPKGGAPKRPPE